MGILETLSRAQDNNDFVVVVKHLVAAESRLVRSWPSTQARLPPGQATCG
jgi:hypothetical protein